MALTPDPVRYQPLPSVICYRCLHSLLGDHYKGECTCGCGQFRTRLDTLYLGQYMRDLQAIYHYQKGNPIASQAKKAYYTLLDVLEQRGPTAQAVGEATKRQEAPLSDV